MTDLYEKERHELRTAILDCRERRLVESAKWAAQQLSGLSPEPSPASQAPKASGEDGGSGGGSMRFGSMAERDAFDLAVCHFEMRVSWCTERCLKEFFQWRIVWSDHVHYFLTNFCLQEYLNAAQVLEPFVPLPSTSSKSCFVQLYAMYLSREKQRFEKKAAPAGLAAWASSSEYLEHIEQTILGLPDTHKTDGFLYYLLGLVRLDLRKVLEAQNALLTSVNLYPCNWSAWKALQSTCSDFQQASELSLPHHFVANYFRASIFTEYQMGSEALDALRSVAEMFPTGDALVFGAAAAHNALHNYEEAQELFEDLLERDPYRIDGMDVYSNILYVKEDVVGLATLARRCTEQDPYRPETCCVVGNYYSLRGQHEKAVIYFRRALRLDPSYLSAWTLMGHEFVELKNPPAAIEAYQKAVTANPRDYRAWYGLGQTYELVNMPFYALHYYKKASELRPDDARMWNALGHCYASTALEDYDLAIQCYKLALPHDNEGVALRALATIHRNRREKGEAAHYYKMNLERMEMEGLTGEDKVEALQFLAQYNKEAGELETAQKYYEQLLDYGAAHGREEAKASLKEIHSAMEDTRAVEMAVTPGMSVSTPGSDMGISPTPPPR